MYKEERPPQIFGDGSLVLRYLVKFKYWLQELVFCDSSFILSNQRYFSLSLFLQWTQGQNRPANGSLVGLKTENNVTKLEIS